MRQGDLWCNAKFAGKRQQPFNHNWGQVGGSTGGNTLLTSMNDILVVESGVLIQKLLVWWSWRDGRGEEYLDGSVVGH